MENETEYLRWQSSADAMDLVVKLRSSAKVEGAEKVEEFWKDFNQLQRKCWEAATEAEYQRMEKLKED